MVQPTAPDAPRPSAVGDSVLPRDRAWRRVGLLLLAGYSLLLPLTWRPAIVGPDDHGYVRQGTTLALEGRVWFTLDSPIQYVGRHWLVDSSSRYVSRYSPGTGSLVALVTRAINVPGSLTVVMVSAILALAGVGVLTGSRLGASWGVMAMAVGSGKYMPGSSSSTWSVRPSGQTIPKPLVIVQP